MAIIVCPNCGKEISDQAPMCPNCKTQMSEILSQNPKKKRTIPILVPVLSVLDGLVLLGTVGLLTFGVMNPEIITQHPTENITASNDLSAACKAISTLHITTARNYNEYHSDEPIVLPETPAPVSDIEPSSNENQPAETLQQEDPPASEANAEPVQNSTPQQDEQPKSTAPAPASTAQPVQTPVQNNQTPVPTSNAGTSPTAQAPKPTTGSNGSYTHDFSGGRVLITTASDNNGDPVYHIKDCPSARKIAPEDESWYNSIEAAESDGRRLCGNCSR